MAETVGEQLRRAREERKLSLEQVFQAIRINPRYLEGIENDEHDRGPSPVQVKGFLRLYADFLGLEVQPLLDAWDGKPAQGILTAVEQETGLAATSESIEAPQAEAAEPDEEEAVPIEIQYIGAEEPARPQTTEAEAELTASQQIFVGIGQTLRERREMLGLTLADVERFTKLRQHYLQALETGQMRNLPSFVQGRGMLSNYAGFLELDVEALLLRFADALQQRRIENMPPPQQPSLLNRAKPAKKEPKSKPAAALPGWRRLVTPDILIGGVIVIALVGFALWGAAQVTAMRGQEEARTDTTALPIANLLIETATPTPPEATSTPTIPAPPVEENAVAAPPEESSGEVTPTGLPVAGDAPLQVYVVARQRAWLKVVEDGKVAYNGRVVPGNAYPFSGKESVELTSGNAAALQIFYNQQDLGSLGVNGQVVSLIFNETGVVKPTAAFTSTTTNTPKPSVTSQPSPTQATPSVTPYIP